MQIAVEKSPIKILEWTMPIASLAAPLSARGNEIESNDSKQGRYEDGAAITDEPLTLLIWRHGLRKRAPRSLAQRGMEEKPLAPRPSQPAFMSPRGGLGAPSRRGHRGAR